MGPRYKDENRKQMMSETRERLVKAAVEEFAREGYEGANINRITQAAGVATGTIYNYFPSKNEMMLAILSEIGTAHCVFIAEKIRQEVDFNMRVEQLFKAGFDYMRENPHQAKVIFAMLQGTNVTFKEHLNQTYQPMFQLISDEILIPGMEQGIFQSLDPVRTTVMIMTFYLGIGSTVDKNGETLLDLKEVAAFVLRALGAKKTTLE
jgi:AcrR family transcriptional regulator